MQCKHCGVEVEQKGNRIKEYCSDKCRMAYKRSNPNRIESNPNIQSEQKEVKIQSEQPVEVQSEQDYNQSEQVSQFPETDKFINGSSRYVLKENSVVDILPKDDLSTKVICECVWCGERFGANAAGKCALYCKFCKTAEGRKQVKEENEQIRKENASRNKIQTQGVG